MSVTTIDLETGSVTETSTKLVTQQHHLSLITVRCGDYEVQVTPEHPLYVKGVDLPHYPHMPVPRSRILSRTNWQSRDYGLG